MPQALAAGPLAARPLAAELLAEDRQLRVCPADARAALAAVTGRPAVWARARLRFGPGRTCEPAGRLLDTALTRAEGTGLDPARLIVASGTAEAGEDIVRVRRKAHGDADWITTRTSHVRIILRPAGLAAADDLLAEPELSPSPPSAETAVTGTSAPVIPASAPGEPTISDPVPGERAAAVRAALFEVIDPDLGVNIVDLGFVREVDVRDRTAVLTMTLTSAACPLTSIMEDQIRDELAAVPGIAGFRVDWQWVPAWRPADITAEGRDQLRAIGFTAFT
ncbi:MAG TPA: iron-sulfur cluster assembly protein [Trebonia sp.]|jgi:metal-sulfur cluster biosynthetic enzyme/ribosomal protein L22